MQMLNSILTLSRNFDYGELVRQNYAARPVETCYLPIFREAIAFVQAIKPDAILLDLHSQDFAECCSFLKQLVVTQLENSGYAPTIFISTMTSATLQEMLAPQQKLSFLQAGVLRQEDFMTLEAISIEILIELLSFLIEPSQESQPALSSIHSTVNPLDSMTLALAC